MRQKQSVADLGIYSIFINSIRDTTQYNQQRIDPINWLHVCCIRVIHELYYAFSQTHTILLNAILNHLGVPSSGFLFLLIV